MIPLDFLRSVWPSEGLYCIATPLPPPSAGMRHFLFETIEGAASKAEQLRATENVFFAVHALKEERVWNKKHHRDKETKEWVGGWSIRTQSNARAGRAFFFDLDIDYSDEKKYASKPDALRALIDFVKTTSLPRPMVVSSGGGLHVYWVLDQELASNSEWLTQASRLRQLALHHGVKIDTSRTTDTASVLRVAGTFNLKREPARPVEALGQPAEVVTPEEWETRLLVALGNASIAPALAKPPDDELGSNLDRADVDLPAPSAETVYGLCGQMARLRALDGVMSEPEWHTALGVLQFTSEGRQACHDFSKGDPRYDFGQTEDKIDRWKHGPTSCQKLNYECGQANDHICRACPLVDKNRGPISFARLAEKAAPPVAHETIGDDVFSWDIPDPPAPYKRNKDGGISMMMETDDGKQFLAEVYPYDLYPLARSTNIQFETEQQTWRAHLPHGVVRDFGVTASTFVDDHGLKARLANIGIYPAKFPALKGYMSAYIQELQRLAPTNTQHNHLGWVEGKTQFVYPGKIFGPGDQVNPAALGSAAAEAAKLVCKSGTFQEQVSLLHFYDDPAYVANQFYLLCSLGSILYFATGHHGVVVNAMGEPGASKSTTLLAAAGLWGNPISYVLSGTSDGATPHARNTRMQLLSNMPLCLDEITHIASELARSLAMNVTQAGPRIRLNSDGTPQTPINTDKSNMLLSTANISLHSLVSENNAAGTAGSVRILELLFKKLGVHKPHEADAFLRGIKLNYGHIGEAFTKLSVKHITPIGKRVIATMEELGKLGSMSPDERFWFSASAAALVAGEIAVKMGWVSWDITYIKNWLITVQLPLMRGIVKEEALSVSALSVLTDYLEYINGDIIKVSHPLGSSSVNVLHAPNHQMLAHLEVENKIIHILKEGFRAYCQRRNQFSQPLLRELYESNVIVGWDVKKVLGAGTEHAKGRSTCFTVNMAHPELAATLAASIVVPSNVTPMRRVKP